jgi:hypothetical protein
MEFIIDLSVGVEGTDKPLTLARAPTVREANIGCGHVAGIGQGVAHGGGLFLCDLLVGLRGRDLANEIIEDNAIVIVKREAVAPKLACSYIKGFRAEERTVAYVAPAP